MLAHVKPKKVSHLCIQMAHPTRDLIGPCDIEVYLREATNVSCEITGSTEG